MAGTVDRTPSSSNESEHDAEVREHENERFSHWEDELTRQNQAQRTKTRIIAALVSVGAVVWAWAAFH